MKTIAFALVLGLVSVLAGCDKDASKPTTATPAPSGSAAPATSKAGGGW